MTVQFYLTRVKHNRYSSVDTSFNRTYFLYSKFTAECSGEKFFKMFIFDETMNYVAFL